MTARSKTFYERELDHIADQHALGEHVYALIRQSKAFIDSYFHDQIELETMAAVAFMSRFYYIRIFKQVYGVTPRQYLRDLRITKAKALLQKGLPVTQVCHAVGYNSLPTFSSAFKRGTGLSPRAFQKVNLRNRE